jgi:selenide,water dikinase
MGARDKAREAGIAILGGHTIDDPEPKYGMVVSGRVHPDKVLTNAGAREGDLIVLTKPIGTGILSTAVKRGLASEDQKTILNRTMSQLNRAAAEVTDRFQVHACTDVTGFGLLGHLHEMTLASQLNAEIEANRVPVMDGTWQHAGAGLIPGGTRNNLDYLDSDLVWEGQISQTQKLILCDAQTSGGLLFAISPDDEKQVMDELKAASLDHARVIGRFTRQNKGTITIKK